MARFYTRAEIIGVECAASAGEEVAGVSEFYYDGSQLWRRKQTGRDVRVTAAESPDVGWWHDAPCGCGLCRPPEGREEGQIAA